MINSLFFRTFWFYSNKFRKNLKYFNVMTFENVFRLPTMYYFLVKALFFQLCALKSNLFNTMQFSNLTMNNKKTKLYSQISNNYSLLNC